MVLSVLAGIGLTLVPIVLPITWQKIPQFFHWPMVLVDRPHATWLPLNVGKRVIALFLVNVAGWALSLAFLWKAGQMVVKTKRS
jgi:hypothetical protein